MDFEPLAHKALPPAHWGYLQTGVDDDLTLRANREAMAHYQLRARRLMGVVRADLKTEVFGASWDMPIYVSAVGSQRAFHPEGELATARAAKAQKTVQMLSSITSTGLEDVAKALDTPPWYQMYMPTAWADTELMVKRVETAGCPVLVWTIDTLNGRNAETATRAALADTRDCMACHVSNPRARPSGGQQRGGPELRQAQHQPADVQGALQRWLQSSGRRLELCGPAAQDDEVEAGAQGNRYRARMRNWRWITVSMG